MSVSKKTQKKLSAKAERMRPKRYRVDAEIGFQKFKVETIGFFDNKEEAIEYGHSRLTFAFAVFDTKRKNAQVYGDGLMDYDGEYA